MNKMKTVSIFLHECRLNGEKKIPLHLSGTGFYNKSGIDLLSHTVTHAVPSAQRGLTSLFGMGRGVTPATKTPEFKFKSNRSSYVDLISLLMHRIYAFKKELASLTNY